MRWVRKNHWKIIRHLVDAKGRIYAVIERGRRPGEYTIGFMGGRGYTYHRGANHTTKEHKDYTLQDSTLKVAKAVGILIVKTQGETQ
jgi:hypothetical protein